MAETVTSICVPWAEKGPRLAVTMTAATFLVLMAGAARVDAQPLQHGLQRLLGEGRVLQRIAGVVQADHEAVADQHVVADAFDVGQILDAREPERRGRRQQDRERKGKPKESCN